MSRHNPSPTPLDQRISSGLKLIASGKEAKAWTPKKLEEKHYIARVRCSCNHRSFIDSRKLDPEKPFSAYTFKCQSCESTSPVLEIVDPWRDNLER